MLPKKFSQAMFLIIMSFGMSLIIGVVVTLVHTSFSEGFFNRLLDAFIYSFPIAVIAAFTMAPIMRPLVNKIASKD